MDKFKKFKGSWLTFLAAALVIMLAGTLVLLAAEKQEHGYLGVSVQRLGSAEREELGIKNGVEVITVKKESAAAKAGIKDDDIIQLVNGEKVRNAQDLVDIISELAPGATIKIGLWRDGKALELTATLGKRESPKPLVWKSGKLPRIFRSGGYLGIVLQELNADLAAYFSVKADEGVLIVNVEKDTPAEKAGLKAGDVIVQMGEKNVKDADTVHEVLADLKKGETVALTVIRHGKRETLKTEPEFNRHDRIIRIFRGGNDLGSDHLEIPDLDINAPEMDIEIPPLPDMSYIEEAVHHVHEKLDRVKVNIEKRLEKISDNFWI
jgi:membrane-associated protease RseP (regulator of RpoE activity)